jgi:hypothetical protein
MNFTASSGHVIPTVMYVIHRGTLGLMTMDGDLSVDSGLNADPSSLFDGVVRKIQSEGHTIDTDTPIVIDNHTGRAVRLTNENGHVVTIRMFFFNNHLYEFTTASKSGSSADQAAIAARYSDSIHFLR